MKKATAIIPCLNEESTIGRVIDELRMAAKYIQLDIFIVCIDDKSDDNSINIILDKADRAIRLNRRVSLSKVINVGLKEAIKTKTDFIIQIDSDGQYDPYELLELIKAMNNRRADLVIGVRDIWNLKHMSIIKKIGNTVFSTIISILLGKKIIDAQSGFRVLSYRFARRLKIESSHTYTHEEIIKCIRLGYRLEQYPISFDERVSGNSRLIKHSLVYALRSSYDIIKIYLRRL